MIFFKLNKKISNKENLITLIKNKSHLSLLQFLILKTKKTKWLYKDANR
jgi:hypothetical protein